MIWIVTYVPQLSHFLTFCHFSNGVSPYVIIVGALSVLLQLVIGNQFFVSAYKGIKQLKMNMSLLVALSTSLAVIYGLSQCCVGYGQAIMSPVSHREKIMQNAHLFEISSTILVVISLGKLLESYSIKFACSQLDNLQSSKP